MLDLLYCKEIHTLFEGDDEISDDRWKHLIRQHIR